MYYPYRYRDFTSRIIISQVAVAIVTRSLVCLLTELRKAAHHTTHRTKQHNLRNFPTRCRIRYLLRNAYQHSPTRHQRHRSRRLTSTWVLTCLFFYSCCKFIPSFTFRVSLIPLCIFYRSVRIQLHVDAALVRELPRREARFDLTTVAHHRKLPHTICCRQFRTTNSGQPLHLHNAITLLNNAFEVRTLQHSVSF